MYIGSSHGTSRIRKFFFGYFERFQGKIEWIAGFIQNRFPHQDRRVITVTTDHFAGILMNQFSEFHILVPVLPSRSSYDNEHSEFIAGIHKGRILGVVCHPNNSATGISQTFSIPPLLRIRQSIAYISEVLMAVGSYQLNERFSVQPKTIFATKFRQTDTDTCNASINRLIALFNARLDFI